MRTAELLYSIASWLESPNNEALLLSEDNEHCLQVVAESCVLAAELLKKAADEVDILEPPADSLITPETIEETAALASAFDQSGDPKLQKMASVLDELLMTIAAPPNAVSDKKAAQEYRLEQLRKKYEQPREILKKLNKIEVSQKAIEKSPYSKEYRPQEHALSSRYCPDHSAAQISRVGEHTWQCELDKKIYNYDTGFTLEDGSKVPGGDVSEQTKHLEVPGQSLFDDRSGRLGYNK